MMGNKFAILSASGDLLGFVDDSVCPPPDGAVPLTDAQWAEWVTNQATRRWQAGALVTVALPAAVPGPRYILLATIRERVTAAGKWAAFAQALDALPAEKRWHLLTLQEGVAADDADAVALLTSIGCDPGEVLAP